MAEQFVYTDINQVPVPWRSYKSARLNLTQINEIMADAFANATGDSPDYGGAKARFAESHHIEQGFWISGAEENN